MNKVIGIISYLPPNGDKRANRIIKLNKLLKQCDTYFQLPIIIIAQNWDNFELDKLENSKLIIYKYQNRLGITGARRALRNKFLGLDYDYLVMLDDDINLVGSKLGFEKYLDQIEAHPSMYGNFKALTLQLFAISKEMFNLIDYPKGTPDKGDFFEDMWLILALKKLYPSKGFTFNRNGVDPEGNAVRDADSTWYWGQYNKHYIGDNTRRMIKEL